MNPEFKEISGFIFFVTFLLIPESNNATILLLGESLAKRYQKP
jgi:hypothetical protein